MQGLIRMIPLLVMSLEPEWCRQSAKCTFAWIAPSHWQARSGLNCLLESLICTLLVSCVVTLITHE